jgi:hypothetical protein
METAPKSYPLPTESLPGLKLSDHKTDLVQIREFIDSRGIHTKNTRIERYIQYLTEVISEGGKKESLVFKNSTDERFRSSGDWLLYVLREIHELMWIFQGLKMHIPAGLDGKLQMLVSGSDFAALDTNPHCRNVQFELRIASYFCQAGCEVDLTTDTDVIAVTGEYAFYVECKRIASMPQFQRRLAEAAKQLQRRMPRNHENRIAYGCIAVDVTKAAFTHNGLTFAQTNEHSRDVIQRKLITIAHTTLQMPLFSGGRRNILQYWLQIHIPSLIVHPPATITRFSSYYIQNMELDGKGWAALKVLHDISGIGNKHDEREIPPQKLRRRTKLTLPEGTQFTVVDDKLLRECVDTGGVTGKHKEDVIAELTLNGIKHQFTLLDLEMLVARISKSEMQCPTDNVLTNRFAVVVEMYMQRYPYENIESEGNTLNDPGCVDAKKIK